MNAAVPPIAKRYWFADAEALASIDRAMDTLAWEASDLQTIIFCLDTESHDGMLPLAEEDAALQIVDMRDEQAFSAILTDQLNRERSRYLQFAFHMVEDFWPAIELLLERLDQSDAQMVQTGMMKIGLFGMMELPEDGPVSAECCWIERETVRAAIVGADVSSAAMLKTQIDIIISDSSCEMMRPVAGAYFASASEQPILKGAELEAATWRARSASAWAEIDRLKSEKRVRAGREAALKARSERDLARQAERSRQEIDRLHRAAGWAGRWRARVGRVLGR